MKKTGTIATKKKGKMADQKEVVLNLAAIMASYMVLVDLNCSKWNFLSKEVIS